MPIVATPVFWGVVFGVLALGLLLPGARPRQRITTVGTYRRNRARRLGAD